MFDSYENAEHAIDLLQRQGIEADEISIVTRESVVQEHLDEDQAQTIQESAGAGATSGGVVGGLVGLLAGATMVALPGIGPVVAAGALATTLGSATAGAGIGAVYGGLVGALIGLGVSEEEANVYAEGLKEGNVMILVETNDEQHLEVMNAMRQANVLKLESRAVQVEGEVVEAQPAGPSTSEDNLEVLNALVKTSEDSQRGFEIAAKNVRDPKLEQRFADCARERAEFVTHLQEEIAHLGGRPETDKALLSIDDTTDSIQQGWLNLKAALTIQEENRAHVLIESVIEDEAAAIQNYQQALDMNWPSKTRSIIQRQHDRIQKTLEDLHNIEESLEEEA
jgi:uncharacterized protein (TIGR02284 family)